MLHVITRLDPGRSSDICRAIVKKLREGLWGYLASGGSSTADNDIYLKYRRRDISVFEGLLNKNWDRLSRLNKKSCHVVMECVVSGSISNVSVPDSIFNCG